MAGGVNFGVLASISVLYSFGFCRENCRMPEISHFNPNDNPIVFDGHQLFISCQTHDPIQKATWYLNDEEYVNGNQSEIGIFMISSRSSLLRLSNISTSMNDTSIVCSVTYDDMCVANSTEEILLVQGLLSSVLNLKIMLNFTCLPYGSVSSNWEMPFTLIVPRAKPVTYDVVLHYNNTYKEIYQTINTTYFLEISDFDPSSINCVEFNVTVIPNNDIGSGSANSVISNRICQDMQVKVQVIRAKVLRDNFFQFLIQTMPAICDTEPQINLFKMTNGKINNSDVPLRFTNISVHTNCSEEGLITASATLNKKEKYLVAYNFTNAKLPSENIVSTFTVQQFRFKSVSTNMTSLEIVYLDNTVIYGALLITQDKISDIKFVVITPKINVTYELESNFSVGTSFVYDIEENGFLAAGINYPASSQSNVPDLKVKDEVNNANCSTENANYTVLFSCSFKRMEIQAILKPYDDVTGKIFASNTSFESPLIITVNSFGTYHVIIFQRTGIDETKIMYFGNITIEQTPMPKTDHPDIVSTTETEDSVISWITSDVGISIITIIIVIVIAGTIGTILLCLKTIHAIKEKLKTKKYAFTEPANSRNTEDDSEPKYINYDNTEAQLNSSCKSKKSIRYSKTKEANNDDSLEGGVEHLLGERDIEMTVLDTLKIDQLDEIVEVCSGGESKWSDLGHNFQLNKATLKKIKKHHKSDEQKYRAVLKEIVKSQSATWKSIKGAMENLKLHDIAKRIASKIESGNTSASNLTVETSKE